MQHSYKDRVDEFSGLFAYNYEAAGQLLEAANYSARAEATDELRIMASGQLAWLGWREGLTADEAKPFIDEALNWSRETDDTMIPLLLFVDGRITVTSGGSAD